MMKFCTAEGPGQWPGNISWLRTTMPARERPRKVGSAQPCASNGCVAAMHSQSRCPVSPPIADDHAPSPAGWLAAPTTAATATSRHPPETQVSIAPIRQPGRRVCRAVVHPGHRSREPRQMRLYPVKSRLDPEPSARGSGWPPRMRRLWPISAEATCVITAHGTAGICLSESDCAQPNSCPSARALLRRPLPLRCRRDQRGQPHPVQHGIAAHAASPE
jgi:hypothetical protein